MHNHTPWATSQSTRNPRARPHHCVAAAVPARGRRRAPGRGQQARHQCWCHGLELVVGRVLDNPHTPLHTRGAQPPRRAARGRAKGRAAAAAVAVGPTCKRGVAGVGAVTTCKQRAISAHGPPCRGRRHPQPRSRCLLSSSPRARCRHGGACAPQAGVEHPVTRRAACVRAGQHARGAACAGGGRRPLTRSVQARAEHARIVGEAPRRRDRAHQKLQGWGG